jgi:hypothetical protein
MQCARTPKKREDGDFDFLYRPSHPSRLLENVPNHDPRFGHLTCGESVGHYCYDYKEYWGRTFQMVDTSKL